MHPREVAVRKLFSRIARYYDLLNGVISLGLHRGWRRQAMLMLDPQPGWLCLDVCSGTGDFALAAQKAGCRAVAFDLTPEMLAVARRRSPQPLDLVVGDALRLPFHDATFECLTLGFALRHSKEDLPVLLGELARVTKPGGRVVSLELSHPPNRLWRFASNLYIHLLLPVIGGVYDREAYLYLSKSLHDFPDAPRLAERLREAGFKSCDYRLLTGGVAAVHLAVR
jgi:demethylmenaquinone methyltransferase/2-methoxy-6-polyprenyl-1,4-benzoquinol methylase